MNVSVRLNEPLQLILILTFPAAHAEEEDLQPILILIY